MRIGRSDRSPEEITAMAPSTSDLAEITISLPRELVDFADRQAEAQRTTRDRIIGAALTAAREKAEEDRVREGYQYRANVAEPFTKGH
jgi:metal-responsive CopG/Arc/MetJ family transcriptional regulator